MTGLWLGIREVASQQGASQFTMLESVTKDQVQRDADGVMQEYGTVREGGRGWVERVGGSEAGQEGGAGNRPAPLTLTKTVDPGTGTEELRGSLHWSQQSFLYWLGC